MAARPLPPDHALAEPGRARLDVRDSATFARGHLPGSGHLPAAELKARRAELPPRERGVLVVAADAAAARAAAEQLEDMGYADVAWLDAAVDAAPGGATDRAPASRLWRPAPFLEQMLPLLPRGRAADVAAGSGREAVHLALNGFDVEAWDHAPEALERASDLARRHGVSIATVRADLERGPGGTPPLPEATYQVVTCFRFLHRPLLPAMARALAPGGALVYETYRLGQERFGHPRRRAFLLQPGELASAFPGLSVEHYEECDPEQGPITARLLARRPVDVHDARTSPHADGARP